MGLARLIAATVIAGCTVLVAFAASASAAVSFAPHADFGASPNAYSVAIGDFNGDGNRDLAVAHYNSDNVSVLLNTATTGALAPAFATEADFAAGSHPTQVTVGDLNGDGKPDLAVTSCGSPCGGTGSGGVSVLLNTTAAGAATPSFATKVGFTAGTAPGSTAIDDLNGDGMPDLAVANQFSSVSVLLNTTAAGAATPSFSAHADFAGHTGPFSIAIGDLNGDSKPDLAVTNVSSADVSVLLNTTVVGAAVPTFATKTDFTVGAYPASIAIGDLNGDGEPDLATANFNSNNVSVLVNTTATGAAASSFATK
ncbi:MAG: hypothetical protein QOD66_1283, partial [Solirubrobacteraceae bacterium]|nr:hypothetical protein [Solirubrobacteraceae bacterium]